MKNYSILVTILGGVILTFFLINAGFFVKTDAFSSVERARLHYVIIALLLYAISVIFRAGIWYTMMVVSNGGTAPCGLTTALKIYLPSWVARYIPGKVGPVISIITLGRRRCLPPRVLYNSSVMDFVYDTVAALFLSFVAVLFLFVVPIFYFKFFLAFLLLCGVLLVLFIDSQFFSNVVRSIFRRILRVDRSFHNIRPIRIDLKSKVGLIVIYIARHCITGTALWCVAVSLSPTLSFEMVPALIGIWIVSVTAGIVTAISPAGSGVIESVGTVLLSQFVVWSVALQSFLIMRGIDLIASGVLAACAVLSQFRDR